MLPQNFIALLFKRHCWLKSISF